MTTAYRPTFVSHAHAANALCGLLVVSRLMESRAPLRGLRTLLLIVACCACSYRRIPQPGDDTLRQLAIPVRAPDPGAQRVPGGAR